MRKNQKDFTDWAKVAEEVEQRERKTAVKQGAIYWANLGVNIGSELLGKGSKYTRPVLVLEKLNLRMVVAIPITSQQQLRRGYREIIVAGRREYLAFGQVRVVDILRLGDFIDEVAEDELEHIWKNLVKFLKYHFYKKSSSVEAEQDF